MQYCVQRDLRGLKTRPIKTWQIHWNYKCNHNKDCSTIKHLTSITSQNLTLICYGFLLNFHSHQYYTQIDVPLTGCCVPVGRAQTSVRKVGGLNSGPVKLIISFLQYLALGNTGIGQGLISSVSGKCDWVMVLAIWSAPGQHSKVTTGAHYHKSVPILIWP